MSEQSAAKINDAIRSCLERCYGERAPLIKVAAYTRELRKDPSWREEEIEKVESTVLKMLSLIVEQPPGA
jgi:hypothetical protein